MAKLRKKGDGNSLPIADRPLRVVAYTDVAGIGGAEISLGHLVATVSDNIDVTVVGISQLVVDAIAAGRPQASRVVLPETGLRSVMAHWATLGRLRRLRDDLALRTHLAWRGREVAAARFTVEQMAKSYERLWYEVVSTPPTPRFRVPRPRD